MAWKLFKCRIIIDKVIKVFAFNVLALADEGKKIGAKSSE
jgi:hypothetical protein